MFLLYYFPLVTIVKLVVDSRVAAVKISLKTTVDMDDTTKTLSDLIRKEVVTVHHLIK